MIRVPSLEPSLAMKKNITGFISCVEKKMFTIKMSQLLCRCIINSACSYNRPSDRVRKKIRNYVAFSGQIL